jgi:hypothetical protein
MLLLALNGSAQDSPQRSAQAQTGPEVSTVPQPSVVTIPAGTRFALVLTNSISTKITHRGDEIYTQTTAPITVGDRVVIPPGTFIQGRVDKLTRNGSRAEILMTSVSIVFPDGSVLNIAGPQSVESDEGTAWRDPSDKAKLGAIIAPMAGGGLGALIGSSIHTTQSASLGGMTITSSTPKGLAIGSVVGLAVGGVVSIAILLRSRNFFVELGSPMKMTLPQPLTLSDNRIADAVRWANDHPVAVPRAAPRPLPSAPSDHGTCYTPDTPGMPPTIIPGTPPIGDSPGTPEVVIPGTPSIPGTPYPCP